MKITAEKTPGLRPGALRAPQINDILPTALLFLAGRASVLGLHPFGTAMFAALYDKRAGYLGITAMVIGIITRGGAEYSVQYVLSAVLFWLYGNVFDSGSRFWAPVACGLCTLIGGVGCALYMGSGAGGVLMSSAESILASFLYVVFRKAGVFLKRPSRRTSVSQEELVCLCITLGSLISGLGGIILPFGITLSYVAAAYAVMSVALNTSLAAAGCGGLAIGLVSSMDDPDMLVIMAVFGVGAIMGNMLKMIGKYGAATGFIGGCIVGVLYLGSSFEMPFSLGDIIASTLLFVLTPASVHDAVGGFLEKSIRQDLVRTDIRAREFITARLERSADAFAELSRTLRIVSDRRLNMYSRDAGDIFDEVCSRVCQGCSSWSKCWSGDFRATCRNMLILLDTMETKGICTISTLPTRFRERCLRAEMFVTEFNHVYELYKKEQLFRSEAKFARDLTAEQYDGFALIAGELSREVENGFTFLEDVEERVISGLDEHNIPVGEVSVIENGSGAIEVYLSPAIGARTSLIPQLLSDILSLPMAFDRSEKGIRRYIQKPQLSADWGISEVCRHGSSISGDCALCFTAEDGRFYALICDGMGTGPAALKESRMSAALIRRFIEAGVSPKIAVKLANSALALKFDRESFSTIDLCMIDLTTGQADVYKAGAAETIIRRGSEVQTIYSQAMPAGVMSDTAAKPSRTMFTDGDMILMMSDGVSDGGIPKDWLKNQLRSAADASTLAKRITDGALKKKGGETDDDMTVIVIRISEE